MRRSSPLMAGARVALFALGASACGGSHRSAPAVTSAQVVIVTSTASSSATSVAAATTSTAPATTTSTTAAPTTTTTISAATRDELAVRAAWKGWLAASEACDVDPKGCDRAGLANYAGTFLSNKLKAVDALIQKGWGVRTGPGGIDDRYRIESVTLTPGQAIVQYCELNEGLVFDPGAGPGGADVIINDAVVSNRSRAVFTQSSSLWKVTGADGNHQEEGRSLWDSCVAAG